MKRRTQLQEAGAFAASAVAAPARVRTEAATTLRCILQQDLVTLDLLTTFACITRNRGAWSSTQPTGRTAPAAPLGGPREAGIRAAAPGEVGE